MLRNLARLIFLVIGIALLRYVIGLITQAFTRTSSGPVAAKPPGGSTQAAAQLRKDPVCGTYVADSTPYRKVIGSETVYYCSAACRDKHGS